MLPRLFRTGLAFLIVTGGFAAGAAAQTATLRPTVDTNVNMVRGLGDQFSGDPYLQRQNEPSIAVSTRNPCHLLAGANDYRTVDIPDATVLPNTEPVSVADAWLGVFKSYDCGNKWQSSLIPGYPQDTSPEGLSSPLKGFQAAADPTVRAGTNGLLYYSGIVFNRGENQPSRLFVARYQDFNDKEKGDNIRYLGVTTVADGSSGQFVDKPWMAVDIPRTSGHGGGGTCDVNGQRVPAGNVYVAWARFEGNGAKNPSKIMFARSTDCGRTFKASPISDNQKTSQGAMIAIAPDDGTVYVAWREFARNGKPHAIHIMRSRDGGQTWDKPQPVVASIAPFDQAKTEFTFRTNALPTIAAAPDGLVYVAYAARGAALLRDANGNLQPTDDARIMLAVSSNFGQTFAAPVAIDNPPDKRGHQVMPALSYAAGMLQILFYDFRDDVSEDHSTWISDSPTVTPVRHTVDVRGAWADATATPQFYAAGGITQTLSQYAVSASLGTVQINYANLPLYGLGKMPFLGDYIDAQGLMAVPVRSADGTTQEWRPNIGPIDFTGLSALNAQAFPSLPVFHVAWTDHRDVKLPPGNAWDKYTAPGATTCDPTLAGIRNANIYTSRVTPGLFAGSPGNTKPLGVRKDENNQPVIDPSTGLPELIQRGFAVFVQNTLTEPKRYRLTILNQPAGGGASFRQFDRPAPGCQAPAPCPPEPLTTVEVEILRRSTIARTVYVKAPDQYAQVLVNVVEVDRPGRPVTVNGRTTIVHDEVPNGLRTSVLLNPDKTNPPIANPDVVIDPDDPTLIPQIAQIESHDPAISPPFYVDVKGLLSTRRAVAVPKNPDPENPDPENPDPENPDPENPDPENPDPENPDPENPDPENPDPENPDPENLDVENTAIGDATIVAMRDVHWTVKNRGNTTSAYHFRPTIKPGVDTTGLHFQLLVTRRYLIPALTSTCKVVYRTESQVIVNVPGYTPRMPDPENPDPENPDPENPDPENPDPENPDPENPDPENPDPENVSFILAPDESATVTLRIIKAGPGGGDTSTLAAGPAIGGIPNDVIDAIQGSGGEIDFSPRQQTGAIVTPQAADTGQTVPSSASAGPDLVVVSDPMPTLNTAAVVPPGQITLSFTIHNRGTSEAIAYVNGTPPATTTIKTRFYLSTDNALSRDDVPLVVPGYVGDPYAFIHELSGSIPPCTEVAPTACLVPRIQALAVPRDTLPGEYYIFAIVDDDNDWDDDTSSTVDNEVFEADDFNNRASAGPITVGYQLAFAIQPADTTQDLYMTPSVTVAVLYGDGTPVTDLLLVPQVSLSIGNNPAGGTLSGTLAQLNVAGFASFGNLSINNPSATAYTLVATALNSFGATSSAFVIEPDLPPIVTNDAYTVLEDVMLVVPEGTGVLVNDRDPTFKGTKRPGRDPRPSPGCPLGSCIEALAGTDPAQGTLTRVADGGFTYVPVPQFNGPVTFTYLANDGRPGNSATGTVTITVLGVNDPPSFTAGASQTVAEDSGPRTVPAWAANISAGPGESTQAVDFIVTADNTSLFAAPPAISPSGTLTFTPAPAANGTTIVTVRIHDNGGTDNDGVDTSAPQTFTIAIAAVNDAPSFAKGVNQLVDEDGGAQTAAGWAIAISPGPADEAGQLVDFLVSVDNLSLFAAQPAISATGTLTYTLAANVSGVATVTVRLHDDGGTANGGVDTSAAQTFTVTIAAVNDVPSFTKGVNQVVNEDSGARTVAGWATSISPGPNESAQAVDFLVSADNASLFTVQPAVGPTGTLTYTPVPNVSGVATVTVRIHDNGGTANGGVDTSAAQTFTITIAAINDAPSFTRGANQAVNEDSGAQTVAGWATSISPGPADEAGQTVDFLVSADNTSLFAVQPAIGATGTLTYTPVVDRYGTATVTVRIHDNGGTANGGVDTSAPQTFTITITAVNDAPSFTKGADQLVNEDAGPQSVPAWATNISAGPNEATQTVDFLVSADNAALFSAQPAISATGTLTYTPAANVNGSATVTVRIHDNGGTANGGVDTSAPQTFAVTIAGVNDPPIAVNDTATTPEETAVVVSVLANDTDPDGNALTVTGASVTSGGGVVVVHPDNTVAYTPETNYNGAATFTYAISDGFGGTASATVTVTVTPVNDNPDAVNDSFTVAEDSGATTLNVRANDTTAPDSGETLTVTAVTPPASGTVTIATGGTGVVYTPPANFNGTTSFTYTISDGNGGSDAASVSVTVTPVNDGPVAVADNYTASDNDPLVVGAPGVLANDTDIDGDALTAVLVKNVLHGTLTFNANGSFTYVPNAGFTGAEFFRYQARDGSLSSGTVDVNITVEANEFPVANSDTATTAEDTAAVIAVLANDTDPDADILTVSAVTTPAHGSATITGGGTTVTYQPGLNYNGPDSFTYTVADGFGGTATATVSVTVTAVNDAPVAVNDTAAAVAGQTVAIDVLANDTDAESRLGLSVVSATPFNPPGLPYNVGNAGEMAVVPAAGRLYASAGRAILVYSLATNTLDTLIPLRGQGGTQLHRLDAPAGILYFRHGMAIVAIDVRPGSATFNQILTTLVFPGGMTSFVVDDVRHRVYVSHSTNAGGAPATRQVAVVDGDPNSVSFLRILASVPVFGSGTGIAVNTTTNKVYLTSTFTNQSAAGLSVIDGASLSVTQITGAPTSYDVVVEPTQNMVYAIGTAAPAGAIVAVDGGTNAVTSIPVANFSPINWAGRMIAVNTVTHRVYVGSGDFTNQGKLVVVDANRTSGTFNTLLAEIPAERDYCDVVVDETNNRVVTTGDMGAIVINGATNTVTGIVRGKQLTCDIAVNPAAGRAYVANTSAGFQVVNTGGSPTTVATIVTVTETGSLVVDPIRHAAYATNTVGTSQIFTLDRNGAVGNLTGLPTDSGRYLMAARNSVTREIYVVNYAAGITGGLPLPAFVTTINGATGAVVANIVVGDQPFGIGINEATNRIYVANYGAAPSSISVIDGVSHTVVATVPAPTLPSGVIRFFRDVAANTTTNKIYVRSSSPSGTSTLWVLDGATNALSPIVLPGTATVAIIRVNSEKNRIYVGMSDGRLFVLDGATNSIVANLMAGYPSTTVGNQSYIAINETTDEVFVANFNNDEVTVLSYDGVVLGTVDVSDGPTAVAVNELTNSIYVSSTNDKILVVIDGATRALRGAVALPYQANFIGVDPADRRIYASSGSPQDVGVMVIADDPPVGILTVNGVMQGALGSTQIVLDRFVLYTPAAGPGGVDTFTYTASDGQATSNAATVQVTIAPALQIVTSSLPNGREGQAYAQTLTATGGTGTLTWLLASGNLPIGTVLDSATGTIRGTPTTRGRYTFTVRVQDSAAVPQVATMPLSIGIGPLVITTGSLPSGWIGQAYSATLTAAPITGTAVWSITSGALPPGFSLSTGGVISGTSNIYGTSSFTVRVTDDSGEIATRSLSLLIDAPLQILTPPRVALLFQSYSTQYIGGRGTRNWTVSGALPAGMSLNATSGITGTPLETGHFPITLTVTDCASNSCPTGTQGQTDTKTFTLRAAASDQSIGSNIASAVQFGAAGYSRIAQIVAAGVTGELVSVQPPGGMACPWPVVVTAEIRRLTSTPPFAPDDSEGGLYASATVTMSNSISMPLSTPVLFPVGARFAVVLTASGACTMPTNTGSDYQPGQPFVFDGTWQMAANVVDFGMTTHVVPPPGLVYTTANRGNVVATPLLDGRILVTSNSSTAEVYDPATGMFTATANNLQVPRNQHAAVLLTCPEGTSCGYHGKVLIAGGEYCETNPPPATGCTQKSISSAELYDPATNQFTVLAGTLAVGRSQFTMTRLSNGTFLIAGGQTRDVNGNSSTIRSAEIFDPEAMSFTPAGDLLMGRRQHTATLISCGGCAGEGKVLIVGGWTGPWNGPGPQPTAELFEPSGGGGAFRATTGGTVDGFVRAGHTATPLANGNVVIAGGIGWWPDLGGTIEVYNPVTDTFTAAGTIAVRRMNHVAVPLDDGRVLIAGGADRWVGSSLSLASVEIYTPPNGPSPGVSAPASSLILARSQSGAARLTCSGCPYDNDVFIVGGSSTSQLTSRSAEIVDPHAPAAALIITTTTLPSGQKGLPYPSDVSGLPYPSDVSIAATGGTPSYTFSVATGSLPPTVVLDTNGAIHSLDGTTLTTAGAYQFVAKVEDSLGAVAYQSLSIAVDAVSITTTTLPAGVINQPYDFAPLAASGTPPYTWSHDTSIGGPPGLTVQTINGEGHVIGTPTQTGCWSLGVRVRDGSFQTVTKAISSVCINQPIDITSPAGLSDAFLKEWYDYRINTNGGSPATWSLALQPGEHLPRGLEISGDGRVRGNALETGTFTFTAQVSVASSPPQTDQQAFTLRVGALDQSGSGDSVSMTPFGTPGHQRVAQIVTTGATGELMAVRSRTLNCPAGVSVTTEIRRLTSTPPFVPDDSDGGLLASRTQTGQNLMPFATPIFLPVGARYAIVLSANGACEARVNPSDSYTGGEPYVFDGATWEPPADFQELGFDTYVFPQGLIYTNAWRGQAVLTPLLDGRVLLTSDSQTAEVYDPATGRFAPTANTMQVQRNNYAAVLLTCPSGDTCGYHGKVLIAGGDWWDSVQNRTFTSNSAELYNPATNQFEPVANPMAVGRDLFTMTRLLDGKVLIAGGTRYDPATNSWPWVRTAEIFDPGTMSFTPIADMVMERRQHTATLISCGGCAADGKVLLVGGWTGWGGTTAELYEPSLGTFRATNGGTTAGHQRAGHTATALANGNIVIAGGAGSWPELADLIEVYDHAADSFTPAGNVAVRRMNPAAVRLADGRILLAGGWESWFGSSSGLVSVEIYNPASPVSVLTTNLNVTRGNPAAVRVGDDVLVAGGGGSSWLSSNSAEIVDVVASSTSLAIATVSLSDGQTGQPYPGATLAAVGGTSPYTFSVALGSLPPRVVLELSGLIHSLPGNDPDTPGAFQFVAQVTDSAGAEAFQVLTIRINTLTITTTTLPSGVLNQPYDQFLTAAGTSPFTWGFDTSGGGSLPPGLSLDSDGRISGIPTQTRCWNFVVRVRDASYQTATKGINLCVNEPLVIATTSLRDGIATEGYGGCLNSTGGSGGVTWSVADGALPAGLTLRPWGCFDGQILDDGLFTFTAQATDSSSPQQVVTKALTLRTWAPDQGGPGGDQQNAVPIGGVDQRRVAQIVKTAMLGDLAGVRVPTSCSSGAVTVEIQGVTKTPPFLPDGNVFLSTTVTPTDAWAPIVFGATRFFAHDERFAIVLSSGGTCQITNLWTNEGYSGGEAWVDAGGGWQLLGGLGYPDLNFLTLVVPVRDLDYTRFGQWGDTSVVLGDGVLMGLGNVIEIYAPATHTTTIGPTLIFQRWNHSVTQLADGRIAIIGGEYWDPNTNSTALRDSVEIYNPATGTLSLASGRLTFPRSQHTATLLANGKVLIAGGFGPPDPDQGGFRPPFIAAELFDPSTGQFTALTDPANHMVDTRWGHRATALADGTVLITGGWSDTWPAVSAEIFYPATNTFAATTHEMVAHRANHTATRLIDGKVLISGGHGVNFSGVASSAEIYDPVFGTFTAVGSMMTARQNHAAVRLDDGSVFVAGGNETCCGDPWRGLASTERFDPTSQTFAPAGPLVAVRDGATIVRLNDGRAAILGGSGSGVSGRSIEFYAPAATVAVTTTTLPDALKDVFYTSPALAATGGTPTYAFSLAGGGLPPGLSLAGDVISGTPTAIGSYAFTVRVTDSANPALSNYQPLTIRVSPLDITTANLPRAYTGKPYSAQLTATGVGTVTWSLEAGQGSLPDGLTLNASGEIAGVPNPTGYFTFLVRAQDSAGQVATKWLSIQVDPGLAITTTSLGDGIVTEWYGGCLGASGGSGGMSWTVAGGMLPPGVTLTSWGCFEGQILDNGLFTFAVQATDSGSPPQVETRELAIRTWAPDQSGPGGDQQNAVTIGGPSQQRVAQIVAAGALGDLVGVRVPVSCSSGSFTVEIQGVTPTPPYQPNGTALFVSTTVTPTDSWAPIVFGATRFFAHDERFAIVLSSGGTCQVTNLSTNEGYSGGEAWVDAGGGWQPLGGLGYPDLNFLTLIEPVRDIDYTRFGQWGDTSVVLDNGRVLMVPGHAIEFYDPAAHTTTEGPALDQQRWNHSVTKRANGRVVIIGGEGWDGNTWALRASAEIYTPDPNGGAGSLETVGNLNFARSQHTATLLTCPLVNPACGYGGKVLVTGGFGLPDPNRNGYRPPLIEAELFDPSTGQFTALTDPLNLMVDSRWGHRATRLADGKVLITGGWSDSWPAVSAEIFDPATNSFTPTAGQMVIHRANHTAALLTCPVIDPQCSYGGKVLIAGGHAVQFSGVLPSAEVFDPATQTFTAVGSLTSARQTHAAVRLDDGTVLVAGGSNTCCGQSWNGLASLERYNPGSGTFTPAGSMVVERDNLAIVLLSDDRVALVGGGSSSRLGGRTVELYTPAAAVITTAALPPATFGQGYGAALLVSGGTAPYAFAVVNGRLPNGLEFDQVTGAITGTPTETGTFQVTFRISDASGHVDFQTVTLEVNHAMSLASTTPIGAVIGETYNQPTLVSGGTASYTFAHIGGLGDLPPGLSLDPSGVLSGTPTATGSFSFVAEVRDASTPQDMVAARLRMSVSTIDQRQDTPGATGLAIGPTAGAQYQGVGQVVVVNQTGRVTGVRLQAGCLSGNLTVQLQQVGGGPLTPAGWVFASETFTAVAVPWPAGALVRFQFRNPPFVRAGESFAIVLSSDGSCFVQQGLLDTDTYAPGHPVFYSSADGYWTAGVSDLPFQTLIEPLSLSGSGTATTDGVFAPNEWNGAARLNLPITVPGGGTIPGTLYVMNDTTDLHVALLYERKHIEPQAWVDVYFDSDANGDLIENGEDLIQLSIQPWSLQSWPNDRFQSTELGCAPWACHYDDAAEGGGTTDVAGRFGYDGEQAVVEMRHPLASGDVRDVALEAGQAIALRLYHQLRAVGGQWPQDYGETNLPDRWGSIPLTIAPAGYRPSDRPFELRVTKTGHGSVTSAPRIRCAGDCLEYVAGGTVVTLTAAPLTGFGTSFIAWGGDCASFGANPECTLPITADTLVDAQFTWNWPPGANGQSVSTLANAPVEIVLTGGDPEGEQVTFSVVSGPAHGSLSGTAPNLIYTPATGFTGTDSFTFTTSDSTFTSGPATVTITVGGAP